MLSRANVTWWTRDAGGDGMTNGTWRLGVLARQDGLFLSVVGISFIFATNDLSFRFFAAVLLRHVFTVLWRAEFDASLNLPSIGPTLGPGQPKWMALPEKFGAARRRHAHQVST